MSRLKKVVIGGIIQPRVAYHIPTDQLGYCLPGTFLGDLFMFAEHGESETLSGRFCNFLDDPMDPEAFRGRPNGPRSVPRQGLDLAHDFDR